MSLILVNFAPIIIKHLSSNTLFANPVNKLLFFNLESSLTMFDIEGWGRDDLATNSCSRFVLTSHNE